MTVRQAPHLVLSSMLVLLLGQSPAGAITAGGHTVPSTNNFCGAEKLTIPVTVCNTNDPGTGMKLFGVAPHDGGSFEGCEGTFDPVWTKNPAFWGLSPGQCATFEVTIDRPAILDTVDVACLYMGINEEDGPATWLGIQIRDTVICVNWHFYEAEWARFIHPLDPVAQGIDIFNTRDEVVDLIYEMAIVDAEGNPTPALSLNGLEPGMPFSSFEVLEPLGQATVEFELMWMDMDVTGPFEMKMMADTDFDGEMEELASIPIYNANFAQPGGEPMEGPTAVPGRVHESSRMQVSPNPFNPSTTISFELAEPTQVSVDVVDLRGRLVRQLAAAEELPAGLHDWQWDGRDDRGGAVASGVYYVRARAGDRVHLKKATLLK